MSTFIKRNLTCAVCGNKHDYSIIASTNSFGSSDLDLRPPEMRRSTMCWWVQRCPDCGYVSSNIEDDQGITKDFLETEEYITCENFNFKSNLADTFYKNYMILNNLGKKMYAYNALLHCAWSCDDSREYEKASLIRKKMVELFELLPKIQKKNENIIAQYVDVLRRSGDFDSVVEKFNGFKSSNDIIEKVIAFQVKLAKEKDCKVYTVSDALK